MAKLHQFPIMTETNYHENLNRANECSLEGQSFLIAILRCEQFSTIFNVNWIFVYFQHE